MGGKEASMTRKDRKLCKERKCEGKEGIHRKSGEEQGREERACYEVKGVY